MPTVLAPCTDDSSTGPYEPRKTTTSAYTMKVKCTRKWMPAIGNNGNDHANGLAADGADRSHVMGVPRGSSWRCSGAGSSMFPKGKCAERLAVNQLAAGDHAL